MKKIAAILLLSLSFTLINSALQAQDVTPSEKELQTNQIKSLIDSQLYVFSAKTVIPLSMQSKSLLSTYELKVSKDTIQANLPYVGKTNSFEVGASESGIVFKSTNFKYTLQEKKKGGWNIKIVFKDAGDVKQMFLSVSSTGYSTLQVTCQAKESISYNGFVQ
jgi:hypothetical protein